MKRIKLHDIPDDVWWLIFGRYIVCKGESAQHYLEEFAALLRIATVSKRFERLVPEVCSWQGPESIPYVLSQPSPVSVHMDRETVSRMLRSHVNCEIVPTTSVTCKRCLSGKMCCQNELRPYMSHILTRSNQSKVHTGNVVWFRNHFRGRDWPSFVCRLLNFVSRVIDGSCYLRLRKTCTYPGNYMYAFRERLISEGTKDVDACLDEMLAPPGWSRSSHTGTCPV